MAKRRKYKEIIRERVVSVRLNEQEFHRLKANGLQARRSMSALVRARMADLIGVASETGATEGAAGGAA